MKKTKSAKGNSAKKTRKTGEQLVDDYLLDVPEPARTTLNRIRAAIRSIVPPEATEGISYGIPTFKYKGPLASFAAFSDHCSLFPGPGPIVDFKDELKDFQTAKGTIRFAPNKPPPDALLEKILKKRIGENERKKSPRATLALRAKRTR
jgi:uncharacterized protein YdhG (YjbR/CyaY superfamily)